MKKLVLALLVAAVVHVPTAEAAYLGCLDSAQPYTLGVTTTSRVAITILVITTRSRLDVEETLLFDSTSPPLLRTLPPRAVRMIFVLDSSQNGNGVVQITQGFLVRFEVPVADNNNAVIDVHPGPFCP